MKVLVVFGTRPEVIKLAPVIRAMRTDAASFEMQLCATAQHRDLIDPLLALFQLQPDVDLDLMQANQTPADITARVLAGLTPVLQRLAPDWIVVQGDTTTTMAAALAARYAGVKIAHVEAGLRTGRLDQPFPEEINRRVVGAIADVHFAPTPAARDHLRHEGVADGQIVVTGNTAIDALLWAVGQPPPAAVDRLLSNAPPNVVLVTAHRRESFGEPLEQICLALRDLAGHYGSAIRIIYPVHPNPNVDGPVRRMLAGVNGIVLTTPLDYLTLVHLLKRSRLVLTDSGGLQEEAPSLGKPVLVMRETTERPEGIAAGNAKLVGADRARIVDSARRLLDDEDEYARMARPANPYGDGHAAERIVNALKARLATLAIMALTVAIVTSAACGAPGNAPPASTPAATPASTPAPTPSTKIDSQLRTEIDRLQNRPAPPGATDVKIDAAKRAFVDVRAEVTPDLVATVAAMGDIVSTSARDRSVLAWVPLLKLPDLAASPDVRAIVPAAQAITQSAPARGQEFDLRVGGAITVTDAHLTLTFERVTDSRCPVSVTCISEGDAVLRLALVAGDGTRTAVEVHTSGTGRQDTTFQGHRIRLVRLTPPKPDVAGLPADRYLATFVVTSL